MTISAIGNEISSARCAVLLGSLRELAVDEQFAADEHLRRVDAAQDRFHGVDRAAFRFVTQVRGELHSDRDDLAVGAGAVLDRRDVGDRLERGDRRCPARARPGRSRRPLLPCGASASS